jgi:hypothetical protein
MQNLLAGDIGAECLAGGLNSASLLTTLMYMVLRTGLNRQSVLLDAGVAMGR